MPELEQSALLFDEARRLRQIARTMPTHRASDCERQARQLDHRAWQLRRQAIREAM